MERNYGTIKHPLAGGTGNASGPTASYCMNPSMEEQFLRAYDEYADAIFRHCFFRVRNDRERAKDITQETFTKVWEYMRAGNRVDNIRAFLYRVATNIIIDSARRKKMYSLDELQEEGFDPAAPHDPELLHRRIDSTHIIPFLDRLNPLSKEAVVMRFIDDLSPKEIAHITGETENVISVRVHRGVKQLRKIVEGM